MTAPRVSASGWRQARMIRAGLGTGGLRVATIAITLATSVVLARVLGPEGLGIYAFAMAVVALAGLPVQLGLPTLVLRETARAETHQAWARLRGLWVWAGRRILIASACVLPCVAIGAFVLRDRALPEGGHITLLISLLLIPLIAAAQVRGAALRGLQRIVLGQLPEAVVRPALLLACIGGVAAFGGTLSPAMAMTLHVGAALLAFALGVVLVLRVMPPQVRAAPADLSPAPDWARAVWPLALITGMQIVMESTGMVVLGLWASPAEVGYFRIAVSAANMVILGLTIANLVVAPRFAKQHVQGDRRQMAQMARQTAGLAFVAALPLAGLFLFAGPWVLGLLYGAAYVPAAGALAILAVAQLVNAFFGACVSLLNMSGHERSTARALILAAAVNVALNLILVPVMGLYGAAWATLVATCLWNVLLYLAVFRHLGFDSSALANLHRREPMS